MQSCDTGLLILFFDSCQLTITWMSPIKFNTDCKRIVHLASNAWSLQETLAPLAANNSVHTIVAI